MASILGLLGSHVLPNREVMLEVLGPSADSCRFHPSVMCFHLCEVLFSQWKRLSRAAFEQLSPTLGPLINIQKHVSPTWCRVLCYSRLPSNLLGVFGEASAPLLTLRPPDRLSSRPAGQRHARSYGTRLFTSSTFHQSYLKRLGSFVFGCVTV